MLVRGGLERGYGSGGADIAVKGSGEGGGGGGCHCVWGFMTRWNCQAEMIEAWYGCAGVGLVAADYVQLACDDIHSADTYLSNQRTLPHQVSGRIILVATRPPAEGIGL